MIKNLSEWLVLRMVEGDVIEESNMPVQRYGLELVISLVFTLTLLSVLAVMSNRVIEIAWAVMPFCALRAFSGGWHADSHAKCIALFMGMILMELVVMPSVVGTLLMTNGVVMTLAAVSFLSVFTFSPAASVSKPLNPREVNAYKSASRLVVLVLLTGNLLTYYFLSPMLGTLGIVSLTLQALSLIPSVLSNELYSMED